MIRLRNIQKSYSQDLTGFQNLSGLNYLHVWLGIIVFLLLLTACNSSNAEPTPPTIHPGETICEFCGMIVSEERFAAGYVTKDGQERVFDDIADMIQFHAERHEDVPAFFVRDFENPVWIRAEKAHYVQSDNITTPMLSGIVAYESREKAEAKASESEGKLLTFEELLSLYGAD